MAEPTHLDVVIPAELGDVEVITTFMGSSAGATISSTTAEAKVSIVASRETKYEAMKMTDYTGANLYYVVIGRVRPTFQDLIDEVEA